MSRPKGSKDKKKQHKWSKEEKEYLALIVKGNTYKDITRLMNEKFAHQLSEEQIKGAIYRNKLTTGTSGHFKKGSIPWNLGLKGYMRSNKTSFKKGNIPPNYKPVGSERIIKDGYIEVKTEDPNKWELKHRVVYKQHYGEIPKGYNVIFADRDKRNFDIENLMLISKAQMLILNKNNLIYTDKELTKTGVNIANVMLKIREIENKK